MNERCHWQDAAGVVHACVARRTRAGKYHVGTVCLSHEDMYVSELLAGPEVVTCLTCLADPMDLWRRAT